MFLDDVPVLLQGRCKILNTWGTLGSWCPMGSLLSLQSWEKFWTLKSLRFLV